MQKCYICEKPIYGHVPVESGQKIICGSCPLNKIQDSGKSAFQAKIDLLKIVTKSYPSNDESSSMSYVQVKSNLKNRTVLLDGRLPLCFDEFGFCKMPTHFLPMLELEMRMRPGRFSVVNENHPADVTVSSEPVAAAPDVEAAEIPLSVEVPVSVEPVATAEILPSSVDQSFLVAEEPVKPSKRASKK